MTQANEVDDRTRSIAARRMMAAREGMLNTFPFWGALALRLKVVCDPSCRTAWTDGTRIGYSPAYIAGCTFDEVVFLWAHEVAHCAFGHPWRRDGRIFYWFNVAADFAINSILKAHGFILPEGVLIDEKYAGRSSEWIYSRVVKRDENENENESGDDAQDGDDDAQDDEGDETGNDSPGDDEGDEGDEGDEDGQDDGQDGEDGEDAQDGEGGATGAVR